MPQRRLKEILEELYDLTFIMESHSVDYLRDLVEEAAEIVDEWDERVRVKDS